jgi:hypothetical protein
MQKCKFHCSYLKSRGGPEKTREIRVKSAENYLPFISCSGDVISGNFQWPHFWLRQPIVGLLISEYHQPSCFEFKTNQLYAFDLNPTNGKPSLNDQSSTFRCTFVYLKKVISRLDFKQYGRHSARRLVVFRYQKADDWLDYKFHCSYLKSRGGPEKTREIRVKSAIVCFRFESNQW